MKPGIKTTEYWGKNLTQIFTVILMLLKVIEPELCAKVVAFVEAVYAVSRGIAKKNSYDA